MSKGFRIPCILSETMHSKLILVTSEDLNSVEKNQCIVHTPTVALFVILVKSFKFTLKYTIISFLHVSVFNDDHQGASSLPN